MDTTAPSRTRRRAAATTRPGGAPPASAAVWPGLQGGQYRPLSQDQMQRIHATALDLLENIGLSDAPASLAERAIAAGCWLDADRRLRFPRALVEQVLARTARRFVLHGFDPARDIEVGGRRVHMGTGGAAPNIIDFTTGAYRESSVGDLYDISRLVDRLDNIHWYHRSVVARDTPTPFDLDVNTAYACLAGTTKPIAVSFTSPESVAATVELFDTVLGGAGRFRERPFCTAVCCHVVPPLRFATEACEVMEQAVLAGMPVLMVAASQAGATSPAALAGSIAQTIAEVLAGLVLANLVDPGCRVIFAAWPFVSDLRTGAMSGGSGEQALLMAGCAQMASFYDIPSSVAAGMTDAKLPDAQSGAEKGYTIALAAQAGATMIHECAGMLGSLMSTALESYVIDNDLLGAVQRTVRGIEVSDDALSYEAIRDAVYGPGHFLGHAQTLRLMRSEYLYPEVSDRGSVEEWQQGGCRDVRERARDRTREILAAHYPDHIDADTDARVRERFRIFLPRRRMQPGNGSW